MKEYNCEPQTVSETTVLTPARSSRRRGNVSRACGNTNSQEQTKGRFQDGFSAPKNELAERVGFESIQKHFATLRQKCVLTA